MTTHAPAFPLEEPRQRGAAFTLKAAAQALHEQRISLEQFNEQADFVIGALMHTTVTKAEHPLAHWFTPYRKCFGAEGVVVLAWWVGALFAESIRERYISYPFLSITGEPGAGKSTLLEFLWKLLGRKDYQGFDPSKTSLAARAERFKQAINLPIVLVEYDRGEGDDNAPRFHFNELKTTYNGRAMRSMGVKHSGSETTEPAFRGAICTIHSEPQKTSKAMLSRMCRLTFSRKTHSRFTRAAAELLECMPVAAVCDFQRHATNHASQVLGILDERLGGYERLLAERYGVKKARVAKNHAQLMGLVDALATLLPITEELRESAHECLIQCATDCEFELEYGHS